MRSLVILEVEHDETTDALGHFIGTVHNVPVLMSPGVTILGYSVRVDVPECFELQTCDCDIDILDPNCRIPEHVNPPEGF